MLLHSRWGAELADGAPAGPIYDLFAGPGHLGLECARLAGRSVVLVDQSPLACAVARRNAARNSLAARTRVLCEPVGPSSFDLVDPVVILADPPTVRNGTAAGSGVGAAADDRGVDGLRLARLALRCSAHQISRGVPLLVQLRDDEQALELARGAAPLLDRLDVSLYEVRTTPLGAVAHFRALRRPRPRP